MESCVAKTAMSGVMGFALGGAFGLFMSSVRNLTQWRIDKKFLKKTYDHSVWDCWWDIFLYRWATTPHSPHRANSSQPYRCENSCDGVSRIWALDPWVVRRISAWLAPCLQELSVWLKGYISISIFPNLVVNHVKEPSWLTTATWRPHFSTARRMISRTE